MQSYPEPSQFFFWQRLVNRRSSLFHSFIAFIINQPQMIRSLNPETFISFHAFMNIIASLEKTYLEFPNHFLFTYSRKMSTNQHSNQICIFSNHYLHGYRKIVGLWGMRRQRLKGEGKRFRSIFCQRSHKFTIVNIIIIIQRVYREHGT